MVRLISAFTESKELNNMKKKIGELVMTIEKQREDINSYKEITKALLQEADMNKKEIDKLREEKEELKMTIYKTKEDLKLSEQFSKSLIKELKSANVSEKKQEECFER